MSIRSGDRIATGTGVNRRRLTLEEAEAGGLPEPFTQEEWDAMYRTSRRHHNSLIAMACDDHYDIKRFPKMTISTTNAHETD